MATIKKGTYRFNDNLTKPPFISFPVTLNFLFDHNEITGVDENSVATAEAYLAEQMAYFEGLGREPTEEEYNSVMTEYRRLALVNSTSVFRTNVQGTKLLSDATSFGYFYINLDGEETYFYLYSSYDTDGDGNSYDGKGEWNLLYDCDNIRNITIPADSEVSAEFAAWFTENTKRIIKAGSYRWNDDLTILDSSKTHEIHIPFSVKLNIPNEDFSYTTVTENYNILTVDVGNSIAYDGEDVVEGGYFYQGYDERWESSYLGGTREELSAALDAEMPDLDTTTKEKIIDTLSVCYGESIKTITVTEDTEVSAEFHEWFNVNTVEQRQISGKWKFNDVPTAPSNLNEVVAVIAEVNGDCNGVPFNVLGAALVQHSDEELPAVFAVICGDISTGDLPYLYISEDYDTYSAGWQSEAYKTIDFGTEPQYVSVDFYNWFTANAEEQKYLSGIWLGYPGMPAIPYETIPWNFGMGEEEALYNKYGIDIEPMLVDGEYWAYGFTPILTRCEFDTDGTLLGSSIGAIAKFKDVGEEDYYYEMTVTYAPEYDTAHIIPGNYNALSVDWVKSNFTELKALSGTWWIDADAPAIPYDVIPYHWNRGEEEALYNKYGIEIEPMHSADYDYTVYGGTAYLTQAEISADGEVLGYYKCGVCKLKHDDEDFYRYEPYDHISSEFIKITVIPNNYNALSVDWFRNHTTNVRFARLYPSDVAYSSGGKCFKRLST